jgi:hypothetical protein
MNFHQAFPFPSPQPGRYNRRVAAELAFHQEIFQFQNSWPLQLLATNASLHGPVPGMFGAPEEEGEKEYEQLMQHLGIQGMDYAAATERVLEYAEDLRKQGKFDRNTEFTLGALLSSLQRRKTRKSLGLSVKG